MVTNPYPGIQGPMRLQIRGSMRARVRLQVIAAPVRTSPELTIDRADAVEITSPAEASRRDTAGLRRLPRDRPQPRELAVRVLDGDSSEPLSIVARVPEASSVNVGLGTCPVELRGRFDELEIRNQQGTVRVDGSYRQAELESKEGDLVLGDVARDARLEASTESGQISARHLRGNAALSSGTGDIDVTRADPKDYLSLHSRDGAVRFAAASAAAREKIHPPRDPARVEDRTARAASRRDRVGTRDARGERDRRTGEHSGRNSRNGRGHY